MAYRTAKFVSAISAGLVVSAPFATIAVRATEAAEECLAKPKEVTPPGQHWYYTVDRDSKRRCWYLHKETGTSANASISRRAHRAAIVAAARKSEPALTRATAEAYAEFGLPPNRGENAPQGSQQTLIASDYPKDSGQNQPDTVSGATPQSLVAARWPDPAGVLSATIERPPSASFVVAALPPDVKPDEAMADLAPKVALANAEIQAVETRAAGMQATEAPASLQPLFLATIGAITLTGFAGSSVYLMAQIRRRPRSHASVLREFERQPAQLVDHTRLPRWLEPPAAASARYRDRGYDVEI